MEGRDMNREKRKKRILWWNIRERTRERERERDR
jgi:hypothetical protein